MAAEDVKVTRGFAWSGVSTSILLAILTAIIGYAINFAESARTAQLAFVSQQIEQLYGPLYTLSQAAERDAPPADPARLHNWYKTVRQPDTSRIADTIVTHTNLTIGASFPPAFVEQIAYSRRLAEWLENGAGAPPTPPAGFAQCVADDFSRLKQRQHELRHRLLVLNMPALPPADSC